MRRLILAITSTAIVVAASYGLSSSQSPTTPRPDVAPAESVAPPAFEIPAASEAATEAPEASPSAVPNELARLIRVFERRTVDGIDPLDFRTLGGHYSAKANITGDLADYEAAADAYAVAVELAPTDTAGRIGYAGAVAKLHNFGLALDLAESLLSENPENLVALAIASDAAIELGRIADGAEFLDRLEAALPGHPAVLARAANIEHLTGDQSAAIAVAAAAEEAAEASRIAGPELAFYPLLSADLLLDAGRYGDAEIAVRRAVTIADGFAPAHASLGRVLAHQANYEESLAAYETAITITPDPGWDAAVGELLVAMGRPTEAQVHFDRAVAGLEEGDETIVGRNLSGLYSDLDIHPEDALRLARLEIARRQDIHAYDTLAWALYRNGDLAGARNASDMALATGAMDAGLRYHSAVIWAALGNEERAVAELTTLLESNPGFSPVQSDHARQLLSTLTG